MESPMTPTKRLLTEEDRQAFLASRQSCNTYVPDDLTTMLQNIGSRIRKNVTEGYATHKIGSVPSTPFSSPEKPRAAARTQNDKHSFQPVSNTLTDVSLIPRRVPSSPSPSPRKRGRAELEEETPEPGLDGDGDTGMESDEDPITFVLSPSPTRLIRPLKKVSTPHLDYPSRAILPKDNSVSVDHTVTEIDNTAPHNPQWTDMFNQEF